MKTKSKRWIFYTIYVGLAIFFIGLITFFSIFIFSNKVKFDENKIKNSSYSIDVFDNKNKILKNKTNLNNNIKANTLHPYTKQAFLSIEDKSFYTHKGLNYKRMVKAMLKNISSFKIKQGASTISQQLIKNTHLTNEKTFSRKFNEIMLTKKLEKTFSKDEILEYYLNIIYFGDNCYGIENASNHYFSKNAKNLTLDESATLAGMIKAPNTYSPIKNINKALERRNLVLSEMLKDNKIDFASYKQAITKPLKTKVNKINNNNVNSYYSACVDEACKILNMPEKQISIADYKIYSFLDEEKQKSLENSLNNYVQNYDGLAISINSKTGNVEAYYGKSKLKLLDIKRQPGSALKPILVYTPALNENIISPITQINDEEININGYKPKNINNNFSGYVSIRDSVCKSLNIPAVKVLSYVGIEKAKDYAKNCNITFDELDNNLGLALGGMTNGTTLKELTNSYLPLINNGNFVESKFINYITDKNGKIVYKNKVKPKTVFREDSCFLMTDMLKSCSKIGTGKKLKDLDFDVATKTGTVGKNENTDAWNITYNTQDIVGVWLGNVDYMPINTFGGALPTDVVKQHFLTIYSKNKPKNFDIPTSIYEENIDLISLNNDHVVYKANNFIPPKYIVKEMFSKFNEPKEKSNNFISLMPPTLEGFVNDNLATIKFDANDYLIYELYKIENNKEKLVSITTNKSGEILQNFSIKDKTKFFVVTKIKNFADNTEIVSDKSNIIELIPNYYYRYKNKSNNYKWYI